MVFERLPKKNFWSFDLNNCVVYCDWRNWFFFYAYVSSINACSVAYNIYFILAWITIALVL